MKVGRLYKLNPKYDHNIGKKLYSLDHNDIIYLHENDIVMIISVERPDAHAITLKLLHGDQVYIFPYSIYQPDVFIEILNENPRTT
jgi:hypothetical protein